MSIVADATKGGFWQSALTATFFGVAGIIGFPLGGWLGDRQKRAGRGRKGMLVTFTLIQALLTIAFGLYLKAGGNAVWALGVLLFVSSLFFNALQPIWHALAADLVPKAALLGAAFGMMNLIGEMGAVLSPAISGVLRDATGDWTAAVFLDGGLMLVQLRAALPGQGAAGLRRPARLSSVRAPITGPSTAATHSHETPHGSSRLSPARTTMATDTTG